MKNKSIIRIILFALMGISFCHVREGYSSATILKCSGTIPKGTPCLIKASTYKVEVSKIYICKRNPFPNYRSTPDYGGSFCLNLIDNKSNSKSINLSNNPTFKIPKSLNIKGEYKYISLIFKNKFTISGKYKTEKNIWITDNKGPKNIIKTSNDKLSPKAFNEKLNNWRGINNVDNKYCDNDGGTFSRCDLNYNGNKLTAIGLDKDFVETFGDKVKYVFYNLELSPPIKIGEAEEEFIYIKYQKNLEVYGNGKDVKSISIGPFIFRPILRKKDL